MFVRTVLARGLSPLAAGLVLAAAAIPAAAAHEACVTDIDKVVSAKPSAATSGALPADLVARLEAAVRSAFGQTAAPGAIIGVATPAGHWQTAIGKSGPGGAGPMQIGMHTRIGSLTKTFTGTMILQLAEDGKVSLDDTIDRYVTGVPNGNRITLRQLLDMTSGIASYTLSTKFTDRYFAHPETVFEPDTLLAVGYSKSPLFKPGARFDYSNTNFILLGKVIEKVSGQQVAAMFEARILQPLKLANTSWPGEQTAIPSPYAEGITLQGEFATPEAPSNATSWNPAWAWTAGEMISDLDDLMTYGRALVTGQGLLAPAEQRLRLQFPGRAGYGLAIGCIDGWVGHTGTLPGYETTLYYDTTQDVTVVVQSNADIMSGDCSSSPTLPGNDDTIACLGPATRIFTAVSAVLGHEFKPNPQH